MLTEQQISKDKWFIETLRRNGIQISDQPSDFEIVMINGENDIKVKQQMFTTELYINGVLVSTYEDMNLDKL